jgi:hypothetical protein
MLNDFPKQLNSRTIVSAGRSCLLPNEQSPFALEFFVHPAAHGVQRYSTPRLRRNDKELFLAGDGMSLLFKVQRIARLRMNFHRCERISSEHRCSRCLSVSIAPKAILRSSCVDCGFISSAAVGSLVCHSQSRRFQPSSSKLPNVLLAPPTMSFFPSLRGDCLKRKRMFLPARQTPSCVRATNCATFNSPTGACMYALERPGIFFRDFGRCSANCPLSPHQPALLSAMAGSSGMGLGMIPGASEKGKRF